MRTFAQKKAPCQTASANPPVQPRLPAYVQTKPRISSPGDVYEEDAERIAEQVMRMPEPQGQKDHDHERLKTKQLQHDDLDQMATPPIVNEVLRSTGQPLDPEARRFFEPRFGHDFSNVRVHTNTEASASARSVDALAFAVGQDLAFGAGQYAPGTTGGRRLLAHELTHVVQQTGHATAARALQRQPSGQTRGKSKNTPVGKITHHFDQSVVDKHVWPNALASIDQVKAVPIGQEVWDQLELAGAIVKIEFVAEQKDIPFSLPPNSLGYTHSLGGGSFILYVVSGIEDVYYEATATGSVQKTRFTSRGIDDISDSLFHEMLHAWFEMMLPGRGTGHKAGATRLDPSGYDPEFLRRLERFEKELERLKQKRSRPPSRMYEYHPVFR